MKIVIDSTVYGTIRNLQFGSDADVTCQELPINEFTVDIRTETNIAVGQYAYLYNDDDTLWAKYWIVDAVWYSDKYITIRAQSDLLLLSQAKLPAKMYMGVNPVTLIQNLFTSNNLLVDIDSNVPTTLITGFVPEQTARDRLQWICFAIGAFIQTDFTDRTKIIAVSSMTAKAALNSIVYYRPQIEYGDWVTGIRLYAYNFFEGSPSSTDEYVQEKIDGVTHTYIQSEQEFFIANPNTPQTAPENVIEIRGITLITYGSGSEVANNILNRLSRYYFKRAAVTADIINNGEFTAGDSVILDDGTGNIVQGYIGRTNFSFGHNHKSTINIASADVSEGVRLNIVAEHDGDEIAKDVYYLPSGYIYSIENKYIGKTGFETQDGETSYAKTLYRPQNTAATGTMGNTETTDTQEYDICLKNSFGNLEVLIVDELAESSGVVSIK